MSVGITGNRTNFSLDRLLGRPKFSANYAGQGNWIQTVQPFQLWEYYTGSLRQAPIIQSDTPLLFFLFCQDVPLMIWVHLLYEDAIITDTGNDTWTLHEPDPWVFCSLDSATTHHTFITAPKVNYGPGEAVIGTTVTNGVKAVGYMVNCVVPNRAYVDAQAQLCHATVEGYFITHGQIIVGAPYFEGAVAHGNEAATRTVIPIILDEDDYTEAMYEDGNLITGPATTDYYVVGLWNGATR